jgi:hypothetical protein
MTVDTKKLEQFSGQLVNDLGATVHAGMVVIGDGLGFYKALAGGPLTDEPCHVFQASDGQPFHNRDRVRVADNPARIFPSCGTSSAR